MGVMGIALLWVVGHERWRVFSVGRSSGVHVSYGPSGICGLCEREEWAAFAFVEIYCFRGMLGQRDSWVAGPGGIGGCCRGGHLRPERDVDQRGFTCIWAFSHLKIEWDIVLRPNWIRGWWWRDSRGFP
jgi:hypothetical protein